MIISDVLQKILREEVADLWAQRTEIDEAIAQIEELLKNGTPAKAMVSGSTAPGPLKVQLPGKVEKPAKPRGTGGPTPQFDWDRGEQLWNDGATVKAIAVALGCSVSAVKNKAYSKWKRRSKSGTTTRKPRPDPGLGMLPNRTRIALSKCPACKAMTTVQPCEMCHKKLPASAIGKT